MPTLAFIKMWNRLIAEHTSNKFMCVSVELESDLFRNTSVCLCGCLSTFTSYKKRRQKEGATREDRQRICILRAPTFVGSPVTRQTEVIRGARQTHTHTRTHTPWTPRGVLRAKGCWNTDMHTETWVCVCEGNVVIVTVIQQKSPWDWLSRLIPTLACDLAGWSGFNWAPKFKPFIGMSQQHWHWTCTSMHVTRVERFVSFASLVSL